MKSPAKYSFSWEEIVREWSRKWERDKRRQVKEYELRPEIRYCARQNVGVRREKEGGDIRIDKYMKRIGKKEDDKCECGWEGNQ